MGYKKAFVLFRKRAWVIMYPAQGVRSNYNVF